MGIETMPLGGSKQRLLAAWLLSCALAGAAFSADEATAQDIKYTVPDTALVEINDADLVTLQETEHAVLIARVQYYRVVPAEAEAKAEIKAAKKALKGLKSNRKAAIAEVDAAKTNKDDQRLERAEKLLEERERALEAGEARVTLAENRLDLAEARIHAASCKLDAAAAARELARMKLLEAAGGQGAKKYDLEKFVAQLNDLERTLAKAVDDREELEARVQESQALVRRLAE